MNDLRTAAALALAALEGGAESWRMVDPAITALKAALAEPAQEPVTYTTGHCENKKQKGGCQLHNLQCGWPDCDRRREILE